MAEKKKYFIRVPGELIEVSKDIYLSYYRMKRRWVAQDRKSVV